MTAGMFQTRPGTVADAEEVREAVESLLRELSGQQDRSLEDFENVYSLLVNDPSAGGVLVADAAGGGPLLGVLTFSRQVALRTGGPYAVIQELWVSPAGRSHGVGQALVEALWEFAGEDVTDIEVGLPSDSFEGLSRTRRFYEQCGFTVMGVRARARRP